MTDEAFDKIVHCTDCGDEILEAFRSTHFCDPVKINAKPWKESSSDMDVQVNVVYQCDKCPEKFHNLEKFSAHLDFHELQKQAHEGGEYENLNVAQRRVVVINDGNGAQSQEDDDVRSLANQFA